MKRLCTTLKGLSIITALLILVLSSTYSQTMNNDIINTPALMSANNSEPIKEAIHDTPTPTGDKNTVTIFPNPSSEAITLQSSQLIHIITIFDILGRVVKQFQPDQEEMKINVQNLLPGKYFIKVQLQGTNNSLVYSFIKI